MKFVNKTYYQLLEVEPTATLDQLRRAWRQVRTTWQPGSIAIYSIYSPEEAASIRHLIEEAWSVLSDPERRGLYDRYLTLLGQGPTVVRSPEAFWDTVHGVSRSENFSSRVDEALLSPRSMPDSASNPLVTEEASRSLDELNRITGAERSEVLPGAQAPQGVEREVHTATSPQGIERSMANRLDADHSTPIGKTERSKAAGVSVPRANLPAAKPGDEKARLSGVKAVPPSVAASLSSPPVRPSIAPQSTSSPRTLQAPQPPRAPIQVGQKSTVVWKESADGIRTATSTAPRPLPHSPHVRPARDPLAPGPAAPAARPREATPALSTPLPSVAARGGAPRVLESADVRPQNSEIPERLRGTGQAWRSTPLNPTAWDEGDDGTSQVASAASGSAGPDASGREGPMRPVALVKGGVPEPSARMAQDSQAYDSRAYDSRAQDSQAYDSRAYDSRALDSQAYDSRAYDSRALDSRALDSREYDSRAYDSQAYDSQALDSQALDSQALDSRGYDAQAVDSQALDSQALESQALESQALDSQALESSPVDQDLLDVAELVGVPMPTRAESGTRPEGRAPAATARPAPQAVARGTVTAPGDSAPLVTQVAAVWHPEPGDDALEELPTSSSLNADPKGQPGGGGVRPSIPLAGESTEWDLPPRMGKPAGSVSPMGIPASPAGASAAGGAGMAGGPRLRPGVVPATAVASGAGGPSGSVGSARTALQVPSAPAKLEAGEGEPQRWMNQPTDPSLRVRPAPGSLAAGASSTVSRAGQAAVSTAPGGTPGFPGGASVSPATPMVVNPIPVNAGALTTGAAAARQAQTPAGAAGGGEPARRPTDPTSISSGTMGGWSRSMATTLKPTRTLPEVEVPATALAELEERYGVGGAYLKAVREVKGITLADIAERTKIQTTYLKYLEEERFSELPPAVYVEGFINQVSRLLKLDAKRTVAGYMQQYQQRTRGRKGGDG